MSQKLVLAKVISGKPSDGFSATCVYLVDEKGLRLQYGQACDKGSVIINDVKLNNIVTDFAILAKLIEGYYRGKYNLDNNDTRIRSTKANLDTNYSWCLVYCERNGFMLNLEELQAFCASILQVEDPRIKKLEKTNEILNETIKTLQTRISDKEIEKLENRAKNAEDIAREYEKDHHEYEIIKRLFR